MGDIVQIDVFIPPEKRDLSEETPIFKYLSAEAFLYLVQFGRIIFSRITNWPDAYEGSRFEFLKRIKKDDEFSQYSKCNFYGSCWTLQVEDSRLYNDNKVHRAAGHELLRDGSPLMWEAYCKGGGVRIRTTIEKLNAVLAATTSKCRLMRGEVFYEPASNWEITIKTKGLSSLLFMKKPSFRLESEYRYIFLQDKTPKESTISVPVGDIANFLDEILISPAVSSQKWVAKTLYNMGVNILPQVGEGTNRKHGKQFCRISRLYGSISETIGHHGMGVKTSSADTAKIF
jgi:hypothetical protein